MDSHRNEPLPEFDSNYIDQLFSAGRNAPKPEPAPAPAPAEPEPAPEVPEPILKEPETAPAKPGRPKYLLILAAAGLLILGFLCGTLIGQGKEPSNVIPPPATTLPPQFGFLPSYESWSTDSLAVIATELPILWDAPVTQENFTALAGRYQVLEVLADRDDALDALQKILKNAQPDGNKYAAAQWLTGYISTYVPQFPPYQWLQYETDDIEVYELTTEPLITVVPSPLYHEEPTTVISFNTQVFAVKGSPDILQRECNFWFLLRRKTNSQTEPDPRISSVLDSGGNIVSDVPVDILPCEEGWLVCGYSTSGLFISLQYDSSSMLPSLRHSPTLPENLSTEELLLKALAPGGSLAHYLRSAKPDDLHLHPLMAALLAREDLISVTLQMKKNNTNLYNYDFMSLLAHESVQEKMTDAQREAYKILEADQYLKSYIGFVSRPTTVISGNIALCQNFLLTANDARMIQNTEANGWVAVTFSPGAAELNDGSWYLEISQDNNSDLTFHLWPIYTDNPLQTQSGWLVAIQSDDPSVLRVTLRNGRGKILDTMEATIFISEN